MLTSLETFLQWEAASRDSIDVKRIYIDMAGDLVAGVLLSQIVFYYLPRKDGKSRLRVRKGGEKWLAIKRDDWWNQIRLNAKQFDRALKVLLDLGIVAKKTFKFKGVPILHVRLLEDAFLTLLAAALEQRNRPPEDENAESGLPENGKVHLAKNGKSSYIESNTEESVIPIGITAGPASQATVANAPVLDGGVSDSVEPKVVGVDTLIRSTPPESAVEIPPDLNDKKEAATPEKPWFLWQRFVAGAHDANPDRAGALDTIEPTHMLRHMKHLIQEGVTSEVMHGAGLLWGTWRSMRKQAVVNLNVATMVTHVKLAVGMVRAGFVQSDVARLMNKLNTDPWWEDKAVSFGYVAENVQKPPAPPRLQREPEPEAPIIPTGLSVDEYVNRMMKLREEAALKAKLEELEAVK